MTEGFFKLLFGRKDTPYVRRCATCRSEASPTNPLRQLIDTFHPIDSSYYCLECIVPACEKAVQRYHADVKTYFDKKDEPKFEYIVPVPPNLTEQELFNLSDPKHPKNFCYQCHRRLPSDYHRKSWNVDACDSLLPKDFHKAWSGAYPMFDTQRCRDTAVRRHLRQTRKPIKDTYHDEENIYGMMEKDFNDEYNERAESLNEIDAYKALAAEYRLKLELYEKEKREDEANEKLEKQRKSDEAYDKIRNAAEAEHRTFLERERQKQAEEERWRPKPFKL